MNDKNDCICSEHSGIVVAIQNTDKKVCAQARKLDKIYARINIVLGSALVSLFLLVLDIILRVNKLK